MPETPSISLTVLTLVAVGGALGACARYLVGVGIGSAHSGPFPLGTFVVNVVGCFVLGFLGELVAPHHEGTGGMVHYALGVGFLGSFTTFSTFGHETHRLLEGDAWLLAAAYVAGSVFAGLLLVRAGSFLAMKLFG